MEPTHSMNVSLDIVVGCPGLFSEERQSINLIYNDNKHLIASTILDNKCKRTFGCQELVINTLFNSVGQIQLTCSASGSQHLTTPVHPTPLPRTACRKRRGEIILFGKQKSLCR